MAKAPADNGDASPGTESVDDKANKSARREIPGNLPYLTSAGTLRNVLDRIIEAQRPDKFNADYMDNVIKIKGGGGRMAISILKKMGFLSSDGSPTELYSKFKTAGGRSGAALQGLRNAYPEIFKRSEYAHSADENRLNDLVVEVTGLHKSDPIARQIKGTFNAIRSYISNGAGTDRAVDAEHVPDTSTPPSLPNATAATAESASGFNLAYNINIVLPETSDLTVLNAIFRSLKENLLR